MLVLYRQKKYTVSTSVVTRKVIQTENPIEFSSSNVLVKYQHVDLFSWWCLQFSCCCWSCGGSGSETDVASLATPPRTWHRYRDILAAALENKPVAFNLQCRHQQPELFIKGLDSSLEKKEVPSVTPTVKGPVCKIQQQLMVRKLIGNKTAKMSLVFFAKATQTC